MSGFEWDESKRKLNISKHGIDFQDAVEVFGDPEVLTLRSAGEHDEPRFLAIGRCQGRIIAVIFTVRGETIRVISARAARREERQRYES